MSDDNRPWGEMPGGGLLAKLIADAFGRAAEGVPKTNHDNEETT